MTQFLLETVGIAILGVLVSVWRARRARRSRRSFELDGSTSFRARAALEGERPRAGHLVLIGGRAVWTARRGGRAVHLNGARLLSAGSAGGWGAQPDDVAVRLSLPVGATVQLELQPELADLLAEQLPRLEAPAEPSPEVPVARPPARSWWAWALVVAGLLFMAYACVNSLTGYSTTAVVVPGDSDLDDGLCPAVWVDPSGQQHRGEADCDDDPAGTLLHERVSGWPDAGDPTMPGTYVFVALLFGLPPVAAGTWRLVHLRSRRRAWAAATCAPALPAAPPADLPPLVEADTLAGPADSPQSVVSRLVPYAARQVPRSAWSDPHRPDGTAGPVPLTRFAARLWAPALVVVVALTLAWPWPWRWYQLQSHATTTVMGSSTGTFPVDDAGPVPGELTVQFPLPDGTVTRADVTTHAKPAAGQELTVVYATDAPQWARLTGEDDDLGIGMLIWSLATGLALLVAGWRVRSLALARAAIRRARTTRPRPALGLLTADPAGGPLLLVTDPLVIPLRFTAVPLAQPLPVGAATAIGPDAPLSVHGPLRDGQAVVVRVPGIEQALLPAGPATVLDPEDVAVLLDLGHVLERDAADLAGPGEADGPDWVDEPAD